MQWVSESFEKCSTNVKSLITRIGQGLSEKQKEGLEALKVECEGFPVAGLIEMTQNAGLD